MPLENHNVFGRNAVLPFIARDIDQFIWSARGEVHQLYEQCHQESIECDRVPCGWVNSERLSEADEMIIGEWEAPILWFVKHPLERPCESGVQWISEIIFPESEEIVDIADRCLP